MLERIVRELRKKPWNSAWQLSLGGLALYLISVVAGPAYACGPGNSQLLEGAFTCARGEMSAAPKVLIAAGIALASLCWGRAAALWERRRAR